MSDPKPLSDEERERLKGWAETSLHPLPRLVLRLLAERDALKEILDEIREDVPEAEGCPDGDVPDVISTLLEGIGTMLDQRDALEAENARLREEREALGVKP